VAQHVLPATATTTHTGFLDAALKPVLSIDSGDVVQVDTLPSGTRTDLADSPFPLLKEHSEILNGTGGPGPHILTGPIEVRGAEPGDTLSVRFLSVEVRQPWGWNGLWPLKGALPADFSAKRLLFVPFDLTRNLALLPWGQEIPLRPFFGIQAVSPPASWGRVSSVEPRSFGGNLDNRDLVPGSTLHLPVFNSGAGLSFGDGHALQGDGEVTQTALETSLRGTFEVVLSKRTGLTSPRAETPTHRITMGFDPDLDDAAQTALRDMVAWISRTKGISREDAFALFGFVGELRVTQLVDGNKGVHALISKEYF